MIDVSVVGSRGSYVPNINVYFFYSMDRLLKYPLLIVGEMNKDDVSCLLAGNWNLFMTVGDGRSSLLNEEAPNEQVRLF